MFELLRAKLAALKPEVQLQPHQKRVADEAAEHPIRKLLYHSLGSGKSLSSIAAAETAGGPYLAVTPASLRANFSKELDKFTDGTNPPDQASYNLLAKGVPAKPYDTVIADEAHRLRNPDSQQTTHFQTLAANTKNLLLLSGSPIVNDPGDLAPLIQGLTGKPLSPQTFRDRYVGKETVNPGIGGWLRGAKPMQREVLQDKPGLKRLLTGLVDYHAPDKPDVQQEDERYEVPMSTRQSRFYRAFWDQLPTLMRWKLQYDYPLSTQELQNLNSFLAGPRQVSLSILPFMRGRRDPLQAFDDSPKLRKAFDLSQEALAADPAAKGVAFSNFLEAGLEPYAAALTRAKVPHAIFHGGLGDADRKRIVEDYNADRIRKLLIAPSGTEGISLKGTKYIQLLDPHWNQSRTDQSIGRGIRFDSHTHLPEDQRRVRVQKFYSETPAGWVVRLWRMLSMAKPENAISDPGTDQYLERMQQRKARLNQQFLDVLKEVGSKHSRTEASMFAVICLVAGFVGPEDVLCEEVDLIRQNHFYDDLGRHVFDQWIAYSWDYDAGRYQVRAWRLIKSESQRPQRDWARGGYLSYWQDGEVFRAIRAAAYTEDWTQHDPELVEREFLPKELRVDLRRPLKRPKPQLVPIGDPE